MDSIERLVATLDEEKLKSKNGAPQKRVYEFTFRNLQFADDDAARLQMATILLILAGAGSFIKSEIRDVKKNRFISQEVPRKASVAAEEPMSPGAEEAGAVSEVLPDADPV